MAGSARMKVGAHRLDGFALVEMIFALMLIAMLAALALPGLVRATGPAAIKIAALRVSALLREDRGLAVKSGHVTTIVVPTDGKAVRSLSSRAVVDMPSGASAGLLGRGPGLRFFPDGRSSGGSIVIASAAAQIVVSVSTDSGAIHVGTP